MVRNKCERAHLIDGVDWAPIREGLPESADLYIANRGDKLLGQMPGARRNIFWIHNPARYLMKRRYLWKLWRVRPVIIFIGTYHATTYPAWAPDGGRGVIPYGIAEAFRQVPETGELPPPRAIFTSNPLRSLDWLLDIWAGAIRPRVPEAELHLFTGARTYGQVGAAKSSEMGRVLEQAGNLANAGVVLRQPVPKAELIEELRQSRVMLYRGDINETFCLAVGEAQAAGVPAVVQNLGSVAERVRDGKTGTVAETDEEFADAAVQLLSDGPLWKQRHQAAKKHQCVWSWARAAQAFEGLIP
jgi:glycosyltransferase involved in cell wall biosynthesis